MSDNGNWSGIEWWKEEFLERLFKSRQTREGSFPNEGKRQELDSFVIRELRHRCGNTRLPFITAPPLELVKAGSGAANASALFPGT